MCMTLIWRSSSTFSDLDLISKSPAHWKKMACKRDNLITPWLRVLIFLPHMDDPTLKVKFDIQWPWPNFKVTETKMAGKRDNFIMSWLRTFIFSPHIWQIVGGIFRLDPFLESAIFLLSLALLVWQPNKVPLFWQKMQNTLLKYVA